MRPRKEAIDIEDQPEVGGVLVDDVFDHVPEEVQRPGLCIKLETTALLAKISGSAAINSPAPQRMTFAKVRRSNPKRSVGFIRRRRKETRIVPITNNQNPSCTTTNKLVSMFAGSTLSFP